MIIKVDKQTRMIDIVSNPLAGLEGENLQNDIVFEFQNEFVDGIGRLEYVLPDNTKNYVMLKKKDETYSVPINNVLTQKGKILMQLVITQSETEEGVPIFKSKEFYLFVGDSINAEEEEPEGYQNWWDYANAKLSQVDDLETLVEENEKQRQEAENKRNEDTTIAINNIKDMTIEVEKVAEEKEKELKKTANDVISSVQQQIQFVNFEIDENNHLIMITPDVNTNLNFTLTNGRLEVEIL